MKLVKQSQSLAEFPFGLVLHSKNNSHSTNENIKNDYLFEPISQNTVPNIKALTVVKNSLMALYGGLLQYTRFCFHKHRKNWDNRFCEYMVSNFSGSEPAGGS